MDIDESNPVRKIALGYAHDTTKSSAAAYGITIGPATVSITPHSNAEVYSRSELYYFEY